MIVLLTKEKILLEIVKFAHQVMSIIQPIYV